MVLKIKNFNIMGVQWKIQFLWGGVHEKAIYKGELAKKGLRQFADLKGEGAWQKRGTGVFEGRGC